MRCWIKKGSESTSYFVLSVCFCTISGYNPALDFGDWVSSYITDSSIITKVKLKVNSPETIGFILNKDNNSHNACLIEFYVFQQHTGLSERFCLLVFHKGSAST